MTPRIDPAVLDKLDEHDPPLNPAEASIAQPSTRPDLDPDADELTGCDLWMMRPILGHIRQAAQAARVSPDALLGATLCRAAAAIHPCHRLPAVVGSHGSLNLYAVIIGVPGHGKSAPIAAARDLLPVELDIDGVSVSTGEGIAEQYIGKAKEPDPDSGKPVTVRRQTKYRALMEVDEGGILGDLKSRNGNTLFPALRTAWSGGGLSQANASEDRRRELKAHSYRLGLIVAAQPETVAPILDDADAGLPQRFSWHHAHDPDAPDTRPQDPGPIDWQPPPQVQFGGVLTLDPNVAADIDARRLDVLKSPNGATDLDAHADLFRLKVAGVLALLDGRRDITADDWHIAEIIHRRSSRVRSRAADGLRSSAIRRQTESNRAAAKRAVTIDGTRATHATEAMARAIGRKTHRAGFAKRRDLQQACKGSDRRLGSFDEAVEMAERLEWIVPDDGGWKPGPSEPAA